MLRNHVSQILGFKKHLEGIIIHIYKVRKHYCDKVVWPLTQHRPLGIIWPNPVFKLQAVLILTFQRTHHSTEVLLQVLVTLWFKNESLIPIFYVLDTIFIHWIIL